MEEGICNLKLVLGMSCNAYSFLWCGLNANLMLWRCCAFAIVTPLAVYTLLVWRKAIAACLYDLWYCDVLISVVSCWCCHCAIALLLLEDLRLPTMTSMHGGALCCFFSCSGIDGVDVTLHTSTCLLVAQQTPCSSCYLTLAYLWIVLPCTGLVTRSTTGTISGSTCFLWCGDR
jgi:hypothetical protein